MQVGDCWGMPLRLMFEALGLYQYHVINSCVYKGMVIIQVVTLSAVISVLLNNVSKLFS